MIFYINDRVSLHFFCLLSPYDPAVPFLTLATTKCHSCFAPSVPNTTYFSRIHLFTFFVEKGRTSWRYSSYYSVWTVWNRCSYSTSQWNHAAKTSIFFSLRKMSPFLHCNPPAFSISQDLRMTAWIYYKSPKWENL